MQPFSDERLQWIEGRLFCLARMARENAGEGAKRATMYMTGEPRESHMLMTEALKQINVERLVLMAEREVISDYNADQKVIQP